MRDFFGVDGYRISVFDALARGDASTNAATVSGLGSRDHLFADRWNVHSVHVGSESAGMDIRDDVLRVASRPVGIFFESHCDLSNRCGFDGDLRLVGLAASISTVFANTISLRAVDGGGRRELHLGHRFLGTQSPCVVHAFFVAHDGHSGLALPLHCN